LIRQVAAPVEHDLGAIARETQRRRAIDLLDVQIAAGHISNARVIGRKLRVQHAVGRQVAAELAQLLRFEIVEPVPGGDLQQQQPRVGRPFVIDNRERCRRSRRDQRGSGKRNRPLACGGLITHHVHVVGCVRGFLERGIGHTVGEPADDWRAFEGNRGRTEDLRELERFSARRLVRR
jgi:hypothetical protein